MSNLTPCLYCHRLYSIYSLNLHQPKCFDNPNSKIQEEIDNMHRKNFTLPNINAKNGKNKQRNLTLDKRKSASSNEFNKNNNKKKSPITITQNNNERRFSQGDSNEHRSNFKNISVRFIEPNDTIKKFQSFDLNDMEENNLDRPGTQTLFPSQENCENLLMCFVCGIFFEHNIIKTHQEQCLIIWETVHKQLPVYIRVIPPKIINVPSIDGTINITRHNQLAEASAKRCQRTKCIKCGKCFSFFEVLKHECQRFEPSFELYF
uniref:C2H2-type domain-containing protein n=1 Tax=Parastrongyloides trichosuri TaxID=131310 RepID=A0A0N5A5G7_PARTI